MTKIEQQQIANLRKLRSAIKSYENTQNSKFAVLHLLTAEVALNAMIMTERHRQEALLPHA